MCKEVRRRYQTGMLKCFTPVPCAGPTRSEFWIPRQISVNATRGISMHEAIGIESLEVSADIEVIPRRSCLLCDEQGAELYVEMADWLFGVLGNWSIRYCKGCDIAWLDPQPIPQDVGKLYSRYYTHIAKIPVTRLERLRQTMVECAEADLGYPVDRPKGILSRLLFRVRPLARTAALQVLGLPVSDIGALLDVGCGNGEFIEGIRSMNSPFPQPTSRSAPISDAGRPRTCSAAVRASGRTRNSNRDRIPFGRSTGYPRSASAHSTIVCRRRSRRVTGILLTWV